MFRVVKHVVIGEVTEGGKQHPIQAAFTVIANDLIQSKSPDASYEFPVFDGPGTVNVDIGTILPAVVVDNG